MFSFTVHKNQKFFGKKWTKWRAKVSQCRKTERGDPLRFFNIHSVGKHEKLKKTKIFILGKKSHSAEKKLKGGTLWDFPTSIWYAGKQEKPFWFSSLDQIVQFGAIIFCRTFKNNFGQFVWIEKKSHYNSRVSLHEAPTKNQSRIIGTLIEI